MEEPHPFYEELRQQGPVPYDRATGDYWVLRHADAMLVLADRRFGKAALRARGPASGIETLPWISRLNWPSAVRFKRGAPD